MIPIQKDFLNLVTPPARFDVQQTAWYLNVPLEAVGVLIAVRLLPVLGHPAPNAPKYVAFAILKQLREDEIWLAKATDAIAAFHKKKRSRKAIQSGRNLVARTDTIVSPHFHTPKQASETKDSIF